jgi:hypothetical protein
MESRLLRLEKEVKRLKRIVYRSDATQLKLCRLVSYLCYYINTISGISGFYVVDDNIVTTAGVIFEMFKLLEAHELDTLTLWDSRRSVTMDEIKEAMEISFDTDALPANDFQVLQRTPFRSINDDALFSVSVKQFQCLRQVFLLEFDYSLTMTASILLDEAVFVSTIADDFIPTWGLIWSAEQLQALAPLFPGAKGKHIVEWKKSKKKVFSFDEIKIAFKMYVNNKTMSSTPYILYENFNIVPLKREDFQAALQTAEYQFFPNKYVYDDKADKYVRNKEVFNIEMYIKIQSSKIYDEILNVITQKNYIPPTHPITVQIFQEYCDMRKEEVLLLSVEDALELVYKKVLSNYFQCMHRCFPCMNSIRDTLVLYILKHYPEFIYEIYGLDFIHVHAAAVDIAKSKIYTHIQANSTRVPSILQTMFAQKILEF